MSHINGTMTASRYVSTLQQHLVPFLEDQPLALKYKFQQDNAPSHKANITLNFLKAECIQVLPSWPPYSPDLNVIENMWAYVKAKIGRESISTKQQLLLRVQEIWTGDEVKALCDRLIASMPRRIAQCIANKGGFIKY